MKLFTIGDSISQGFMSLAAARTDLAFSTLISKVIDPNAQYRYSTWRHGIPANLETLMRALHKKYGINIRGIEWLSALKTMNEVLDQAEDFYERGAGRADQPCPPGDTWYHNVAVEGFEIADAWLVTPKLCKAEIQKANRARGGGDDLFGVPNAFFYRTALQVLNPSRAPQYDDYSQLLWLHHHVKAEGVENLVLWLGANNALGTVLGLEVRQTPGDKQPAGLDHLSRKQRGWNLWHPADFAAEYEVLLEQVDGIMRQNAQANWKVFLGTVPLVTIAPLAKGVGPTSEIPGKGIYYKYYTYFPFEEDFVRAGGWYLSQQDAIHIDDCIREYNDTIKRLVQARNAAHGQERYVVVDIAEALRALAWKRNGGAPTYVFPDYFKFVYPKVNTKYYHADPKGRLRQGGIFGLDGVHPTAIGQGLIAWEFLKKMDAARADQLDWAAIFRSDSLYSQPIPLMQEIYEHQDLAKHLVRLLRYFQD
jgi:hypothetical protein